MITKYSKYNNYIISESIYTQKDIDAILDKGFENFDESDFTVLNSYATNDKNLKEVINKIKNYQEPFELLNKQIKEEKDGIKKRQLFRKWLNMHEELSDLENELRFKYKIEDLNKIKHLEESCFNEKYEFECILIVVRNVEEASKIKKILEIFCNKYDIDDSKAYDFFDHLINNNAIQSPIYIRLVIYGYNELIFSWGRMSKFEENQSNTNYSYEKFFTLKDLESGVLDNIKTYGKSNAAPSYRPRSINRTLDSINETFKFFYDNRSLEKETDKPLFRIGDIVTIKPDGLKIHLSNIEGHYVEMIEIKELIYKNIGKTLTVDDLAVDDKGLWVINCKSKDGEYFYVQQYALTKFAPTYQPRRIDKSI